MDSQKFIIENGVPKFYYSGTSYLEKLKNGLSLDYVFELENYCSTFEMNIINTSSVQFTDCTCKNMVLKSSRLEKEEVEIVFPKKRKGKWVPLKKKLTSNFKKNRCKQLGNTDKLFNLEQNTIFEFDSEAIDEEYEVDDDDLSYEGNHFRILNRTKIWSRKVTPTRK
jgi:hypothetical protein